MILNNTLIEYAQKMYNHAIQKEQYDDWKIIYTIVANRLDKNTNPSIKVINIEDELLTLCQETDNTSKNRKLFYDDMFINKEIFVNGFIIKGIFVSNTVNDLRSNICFALIKKEDSDKGSITTFNLNDSLNSPPTNVVGEKSTINIDAVFEAEKKCATIIANLIDFVEFQRHEYQLVETHYSKDNDEKRIRKGKSPIASQVYIKLNEKIKVYAQTLNERRGFSHKFLVRGHWRHYQSEMTVWIKPYIKGTGIFVNKDVTVEAQK